MDEGMDGWMNDRTNGWMESFISSQCPLHLNGWCGETEDPVSVCLFATTTRTWRWNISDQVRLILRPRFCHLGGCKIGLVETVNGSEWIGSDRHTDRPSELIYRICIWMLIFFTTWCCGWKVKALVYAKKTKHSILFCHILKGWHMIYYDN